MAALDPPHWQRLRDQIPVTQRSAYFNSGWSGPMPIPVVHAIERALHQERDEGPTSRAAFQAHLDQTLRLRRRLAALVGADPEEIALTRNTTEGMNIVFNGLPWQPGDVVVTTSVEHSSGLIPCFYLRQRRGVALHMVHTTPADSPGEMLEKFAAAIVPGTRLVVLSHISYSTGQLFPLAEIQRLTHSRGTRLLVDGAQGLGQIPLDLHGDAIDYYAMPGHKWLLGPDGQGALYVRRDLLSTLEPTAVAWHAAKTFDYAGETFVPEREAITKFELTSMSRPLMAGMEAALDFYTAADPSAVWERIQAAAAAAVTRLAAIDRVTVTSPSATGPLSGLVTFRVAGLPASRVSQYLEATAGVVCRAVAEVDAVRLSTHYFNTDAEIDRLVTAVTAAVVQGIPDAIDGAPLRPRPPAAGGERPARLSRRQQPR